jgi:nucleotide-binding universal stress UspA family protein
VARTWPGQSDGTGFELGGDGPTSILVGVDGTDSSMRAAAYAAGLARRQASKLVVVHVSSIGGLAATVAVGAVVEAEEQLDQELTEMLAQVRDRLGLAASFVRARGNPYIEIVRVADELRVDAIVVGASRQAGHRLVGSLATKLVRTAKWPVTVVP